MEELWPRLSPQKTDNYISGVGFGLLLALTIVAVCLSPWAWVWAFMLAYSFFFLWFEGIMEKELAGNDL